MSLLPYYYAGLLLNITNSSDCLFGTPQHVPTHSPFCAVPVGDDLTTVLRGCCDGARISTWPDIGQSLPCYQYCNVATDKLISTQKCLADALGAQNLSVPVSCGQYPSSAAAARPPAGLVAWATLGLLAAGIVFGGELI